MTSFSHVRKFWRLAYSDSEFDVTRFSLYKLYRPDNKKVEILIILLELL